MTNEYRNDAPIEVFLTLEAKVNIEKVGVYPFMGSNRMVPDDHSVSDSAITGWSKGRYFLLPLSSVIFVTQKV